MDQAVRSLNDDTLRYFSRSDFTKLRNALTTGMMIRSVRRSLDFIEFTLGEFRSIRPLDQPEKQESRVYLLKIKTQEYHYYGPIGDTIA